MPHKYDGCRECLRRAVRPGQGRSSRLRRCRPCARPTVTVAASVFAGLLAPSRSPFALALSVADSVPAAQQGRCLETQTGWTVQRNPTGLTTGLLPTILMPTRSLADSHDPKRRQQLGRRRELLRPGDGAGSAGRARAGRNPHPADRAAADGQDQPGAGAAAPPGRNGRVRGRLRRSGGGHRSG